MPQSATLSKADQDDRVVPKADVSNRSKAGFPIAELIEPERAAAQDQVEV